MRNERQECEHEECARASKQSSSAGSSFCGAHEPWLQCHAQALFCPLNSRELSIERPPHFFEVMPDRSGLRTPSRHMSSHHKPVRAPHTRVGEKNCGAGCGL